MKPVEKTRFIAPKIASVVVGAALRSSLYPTVVIVERDGREIHSQAANVGTALCGRFGTPST